VGVGLDVSELRRLERDPGQTAAVRGDAAVRAELDAGRTRSSSAELERWPDDAGPFGPETWARKMSEIAWIGPHEREHAEMIATL
jgi:hypothetical protein